LSLVKTVYIIVGPTAVGKTAFAISLAQALHTEIISADARQCYGEMNIGVARPSKSELAALPHHFIASHSINDTINASVFERYALDKVEALFKTKDAVVMVGGTGLYIKAFCEGLDMIPQIDPKIRAEIIQQYEKLGLRWLQKEVSVKDPIYWEKGEQQNPQRLMRALEVKLGTGESIVHFQQKNKITRPFHIVKIGLEMPREMLYDRINQRVMNMVEEGLEQEVKSLLPHLQLNALQTAILKFAKLEINSDIKLTKLQKNYYNEQFDIVNKQLATQEAILGGNGELNNYKLQFLLAEIYKRIKIFV
jgi:tRNA dimethylallyltransferase